MTHTDNLLQAIADILEIPVDTLTPAMTRAELPSWDSMHHLSLIMAVEQQLGIDVAFDDILAIDSVGDLLALAAPASASP